MSIHRHFISTPRGLAPQTFRLDPPYLDAEQERPLRDAQFYKWSNHIILRSLDYYILQQQCTQLEDYLNEQDDYWQWVAKGTGLLGIKIGAYVSELPEYWQLDSRTRALANQIETIRTEIFWKTERERQVGVSKRSRWFRHRTRNPPVHVANRLIEEVKFPPPFIPVLTRRFSFS